ncbi:hypothetical protein ACFQ6N_15765 [Kitasatospora sp. NPDC056446]|uniref:hypothetical protein n=1 Tax=Kitasatospora sp. NPDC056446 TaxID=3345819 RepID=UPI0036769369
MKRTLGVVVTLVLLGGVAFALIPDDKPAAVETVTGEIGSEKDAFFQDPEVVAELKAKGLQVQSTPIGSWSMNDVDVSKFDFAFPASKSAANTLLDRLKIKSTAIAPFTSPLVVLAHRPVAELLQKNDMAAQDPNTNVWTLKMAPYLDALDKGRRWSDLKGAEDHKELGNGAIFVRTTDPTRSSSGSLYIALLSYLQNNTQVVSDEDGVQATKGLLRKATVQQGDQQTSTGAQFTDFITNRGPLAFVYESQAADVAVQGTAPEDMVVLYPDITYVSDHTVVPMNPKGEKLAALLRDDPKLVELETKHGFRVNGQPAFLDRLKGKKGPVFAQNIQSQVQLMPAVPETDLLKRMSDLAKGVVTK